MSLMSLLSRFLKYVHIDTQSDPHSLTVPSTMKQLVLIELLDQELKALGVSDIRKDPYGNLYATIASNTSKPTSSIGFMAHVDTATEMSGADVKPKVIEDYDGTIISLNKALGIVLDPKVFPSLLTHQGKTIVTTDGTTLLGADDKAGVAIIMSFVEYIMTHPECKHGPIQIAFTCDEEIGRGVAHFDPALFKADFAYTLDGGPIDRINIENFNASSATVTITGKAIHPGSAKDQMLNAQTIASEFHLAIPLSMRPEHTEHYQGFIHLTESTGSVEVTTLRYIIRDHDLALLKEKEQFLKTLAKQWLQTYPQASIIVNITHSYSNMKTIIDQCPEGLNKAKKAYQTLNLPLSLEPIRGGTDGSNLSFMGVPTPNLATGGYNYHGKFEYLVIEDAETMVSILQEIVRV